MTTAKENCLEKLDEAKKLILDKIDDKSQCDVVIIIESDKVNALLLCLSRKIENAIAMLDYAKDDILQKRREAKMVSTIKQAISELRDEFEKEHSCQH